jgi:predicted secreted protein
MAVISGIGGSITFSSGYVATVQNWDMTITAEALDATTMAPADGFKIKLGGLKDWSGSFTSLVDASTFANIDDQLGGGPTAAVFILEGGASDPQISGTIIITDIAVTASTDNAVAAAFSYQGSGACTFANSA